MEFILVILLPIILAVVVIKILRRKGYTEVGGDVKMTWRTKRRKEVKK